MYNHYDLFYTVNIRNIFSLANTSETEQKKTVNFQSSAFQNKKVKLLREGKKRQEKCGGFFFGG